MAINIYARIMQKAQIGFRGGGLDIFHIWGMGQASFSDACRYHEMIPGAINRIELPNLLLSVAFSFFMRALIISYWPQ